MKPGVLLFGLHLSPGSGVMVEAESGLHSAHLDLPRIEVHSGQQHSWSAEGQKQPPGGRRASAAAMSYQGFASERPEAEDEVRDQFLQKGNQLMCDASLQFSTMSEDGLLPKIMLLLDERSVRLILTPKGTWTKLRYGNRSGGPLGAVTGCGWCCESRICCTFSSGLLSFTLSGENVQLLPGTYLYA
ncbi:hypothetical protein GBF38_012730 [Nibea albiflora]|uniref:Uncharacterized protein n=1 Tax=Nibea albiflora TaxID=240163 RepID=A0ACB7EN53_NIBAL|nr:hypothetical protein GBF38_012730 [Nibea albiflora]